MATPFSLSLVVPVHNDAEGLTRLLRQAEAFGVFQALVVCDDASTPPCRPADLGFDEAALGITYLRSEICRGAGHARNQGLAAVATEHVLFFDADDLLTEALVDLIADLEGLAFDFCLFRHIDSRERAKGHPGPMPVDQGYWEAAGLAQTAPTLLNRAQQVRMTTIAAYPWNKIYRTGFLRDHGIRCTEIPVHNDIELHWSSFLLAERIYASNALCCEHFVHTGGGRLTNRRGVERLEVFQALAPLHQTLAQSPLGPEVLWPLAQFEVGLCGWILTVLDTIHHAAFLQRARVFFLTQYDSETLALIASRAPRVVRDMMALLRREADVWETALDTAQDREAQP